MLKRKDDVVAQNTKGIEFLFRKNKVTWAKGRGTLRAGNLVDVAGADGSSTTYEAKNVIIATGSLPIELPFLKFDEERVLSNIGALKIPVVPKHLVVIGGGVIGLELGSVWRRLGAKVTVVELMPGILPGTDEEVVKEADSVFRKQGLDLRTGTKVTGARREGDTIFLDVEKNGTTETLEADYVLVSVGRKPVARRHRRRGARARARHARRGARRRPDAHEPARTCSPSATASAASCSRTRPRKRA